MIDDTAKRPLISVIIPAYNGGKYIASALDCLFRQAFQPLEIVVVDDGSTDNTAEIVAGYGSQVRYFRKQNSGVAATRNEGIRLSSGDFVSFLDQDDWWPDHMLEKTIARFTESPEMEIVIGSSKVIFEEGAVKELYALPEEQLTAPVIQVGSALYRRSAFEKIGFFNEELHAANDLDWFNRARETSVNISVIPDITLYYRRHTENASNDIAWMRTEMLKAFKLSLDRRRSQGTMMDIPSMTSFLKE